MDVDLQGEIMRYIDFTHMNWYRYLMKNELAPEISLGFPFLSYEDKKLSVTFYPHISRFREGRVIFYPAECQIVLRYPFRNMEKFTRYHQNIGESIGSVDAAWLAGEGKIMLTELYDRFDALLENFALNGYEVEKEIRIYQERLKAIMECMHLEALEPVIP